MRVKRYTRWAVEECDPETGKWEFCLPPSWDLAVEEFDSEAEAISDRDHRRDVYGDEGYKYRVVRRDHEITETIVGEC